MMAVSVPKKALLTNRKPALDTNKYKWSVPLRLCTIIITVPANSIRYAYSSMCGLYEIPKDIVKPRNNREHPTIFNVVCTNPWICIFCFLVIKCYYTRKTGKSQPFLGVFLERKTFKSVVINVLFCAANNITTYFSLLWCNLNTTTCNPCLGPR